MRFNFRPATVGFYHFWPKYAINPGGVLGNYLTLPLWFTRRLRTFDET
jgi:hypothetical protein